MSGTLFISISIIAYCIATWFMWQSISNSKINSERFAQISIGTSFLALIAHATPVANSALQGMPLDFSLSTMTMLISAIIMLIFLLGCLGMRIRRLGIVMFPLAAIGLLFAAIWSSDTAASGHRLLPLSAFSAHVLVAILAYSLLTIATVQSLLYVYQEKQFKNRAAPSVLASLPPLQTMEQLLFRLLGLGFAMLTFTLLSGALFSHQIFAKPFEFNHHTVLATLGWCVFATLLYRRVRHGLRGAQATWWTLTGFLLIQLGYFGTKFINESLNL